MGSVGDGLINIYWNLFGVEVEKPKAYCVISVKLIARKQY